MPVPKPVAPPSRNYLSPDIPVTRRSLRDVLSLDDFEAAAHRRLPRPLFGYIAGAAENNTSMRGNRVAFDDYAFVPDVLVNVASRTQEVELFGHRYASPFGIAPMGLNALFSYRGDIALARAAQAANIPNVLSGTSLIAMEHVVAQGPATWFQAYLPGDASRVEALVRRVARAGIETLVLTVDVPVAGNRENNVRAGFSTPLRPGARLLVDGLVRPRWLMGTFARTLMAHGMPHFENSFAERGEPILSARATRSFSAREHLDWEHVAQVRRLWRGSLVVKGILSAADAIKAKACGVDGIVVSNHGGRQLDGAVSPLHVLPGIVAAVGTMPVMIDSGFRRGGDVLKAMALGARLVFVGRPFCYAAAVASEAGVLHAIGILRDEIDRDMALLGVRQCAQLSPAFLVRRTSGAWAPS